MYTGVSTPVTVLLYHHNGRLRPTTLMRQERTAWWRATEDSTGATPQHNTRPARAATCRASLGQPGVRLAWLWQSDLAQWFHLKKMPPPPHTHTRARACCGRRRCVDCSSRQPGLRPAAGCRKSITALAPAPHLKHGLSVQQRVESCGSVDCHTCGQLLYRRDVPTARTKYNWSASAAGVAAVAATTTRVLRQLPESAAALAPV